MTKKNPDLQSDKSNLQFELDGIFWWRIFHGQVRLPEGISKMTWLNVIGTWPERDDYEQ